MQRPAAWRKSRICRKRLRDGLEQRREINGMSAALIEPPVALVATAAVAGIRVIAAQNGIRPGSINLRSRHFDQSVLELPAS